MGLAASSQMNADQWTVDCKLQFRNMDLGNISVTFFLPMHSPHNLSMDYGKF